MAVVLYPLMGLLGLAILMIVHEGGHYLVARAFNMRVERFAIGIGPTIWKHQPRGSDTIFQVGLIPFLAYVQIAGMNPFEEVAEDDKGSYANASLVGRISAIIAGPAANYIFASIVFFGAFMMRGQPAEGTGIVVNETAPMFDAKGSFLKDEAGEIRKMKTPASRQDLKTGDQILSINGKKLSSWNEIPKHIEPAVKSEVVLKLKRDGQVIERKITTGENGGKGYLGVSRVMEPYEWNKAALLSIEQPALIVQGTLMALGRMFSGKEKAQLSGPLGLMRETGKAAQAGFGYFMGMMGLISTSLAFFNMLPIPALDGGRLMFLGYEAVTRRRPNQKVEAQVHMIGMVMLLTTMVLVTYREWNTDKTPSEQAREERIRQEEEAEKKSAAGASQKSNHEGTPQADAETGKPNNAEDSKIKEEK